MKIGTFSILVGGSACNAHCPFCVSKMTLKAGVEPAPSTVNWQRFDTSLRFAVASGVTTALLTSKGEPTLWPELLTAYLQRLDGRIPIIELQTNGTRLPMLADEMEKWRFHGLTTVALSCVHTDRSYNEPIYGNKYLHPDTIVELLHKHGFSVRLTLMMLKGIVDNPKAVADTIHWCKHNNVEQLTIRSIAQTNLLDLDIPLDAFSFTHEHKLDKGQEYEIQKWLDDTGTHILTLQHGSKVYDVHGQNVCLSDCLTIHPEGREEVRQIIFFPDGHLRYDWQYGGAIIL